MNSYSVARSLVAGRCGESVAGSLQAADVHVQWGTLPPPDRTSSSAPSYTSQGARTAELPVKKVDSLTSFVNCKDRLLEGSGRLRCARELHLDCLLVQSRGLTLRSSFDREGLLFVR